MVNILQVGNHAHLYFHYTIQYCRVKYTHDKKFIQAFGSHLKKVRLSKNITQADLAAQCGVEISQISRIERGIFSTSVSTVYIIAKALEVHHRKLFDFDIE